MNEDYNEILNIWNDNISTEKVISLVCELVTKMKNFIRYEVYEKEEIAN